MSGPLHTAVKQAIAHMLTDYHNDPADLILDHRYGPLCPDCKGKFHPREDNVDDCGYCSHPNAPTLGTLFVYGTHAWAATTAPPGWGGQVSEPLYQRGFMSMDLTEVTYDPLDCTFGVQINEDGRVWVCVNGQTFLRFKPTTRLDTTRLDNTL